MSHRLEEEVTRQFLKMVGRTTVTYVVKGAPDMGAERRARAELALAELADLLGSGALSPAAYAAASQRLEDDLAAPVGTDEDRLVDTGETYQSVWDRSTVDERRTVLAAAVDSVVVLPGYGKVGERVQLRWRS